MTDTDHQNKHKHHPPLAKLHPMKKLSLLLFIANWSLLIAPQGTVAQGITVTVSIPADVSTLGLEASDLRYLEHEVVVDVPSTGSEVRISLGSAPGDTSFVNRVFPLVAQQWADGTWVAPTPGGGWQVGLGRYMGMDSFAVGVRNMGGDLIGTGSWTRP
jgi:hypothetical protein